MFYSLLYSLHKYISAFNVFRYITVRTALSFLTSLLLSFIITPFLIKKFKQLQIKEKGRDFTPIRHRKKRGIPTMGGFIIFIAIIVSTLFWTDLKNRLIWIAISSVTLLSFLGMMDDYLKLKGKGIAVRYKFIGQIILGLLIGIYLFYKPLNISDVWHYVIEGSNYKSYLTHTFATKITIPFLKDFFIDFGLVYILFACLIMVGSSNAVNLTDGLDGLAIGCINLCAVVYGIFAYLIGNWKLSQYLNVLFVEGAGELTIFCASIVGAGLGFLWFNTYPAQIFMGDTGSLALGGAIGIVALLVKQELLLVIVGGIFVIESASVILQISSIKIRKKKIFKMTPLHHHFELLGWSEPKIIVRFWIVAIIFSIISLTTLKLR